MRTRSRLLLCSTLLSGTALAQPFAPLDARAMAMGDTGVASATTGSAVVYNPALLSNGRIGNPDAIHVILPNLGAGIFADPDAVDSYDNIVDEAYLDAISNSVNAMESAITNLDDNAFVSAKQDLTSKSHALNNDLNALSEQPFRLDASALFSVAAARRDLGMAAFASSNITLESAPIISSCDSQLLEDYTSFFESVNSITELAAAAGDSSRNQAGCNNQPIVDPATASIVDPTADLSSSVLVAGVALNEVGVSLSTRVQVMGQDVAVGITPKLQSVNSYYTVATVQQLDDQNYDLFDELQDSKRTKRNVNLDLGLATDLLDERLTLALVVKNLVAHRYETTPNQDGKRAEFDVETQVRAGLAWKALPSLTLAADLDLLKNQPYFLGDDTQFLGAGVEWDVARLVRLRGGVRTNLANSEEQVVSAGIGFNLIAVYMDLGMQYGNNNVAGALQAGIVF